MQRDNKPWEINQLSILKATVANLERINRSFESEDMVAWNDTLG